MKTNIGKYFFRLLNKHFPPGHKLYKIFNKNTLKLSYSCMPNLKAKIDGHNKKIPETTLPPKKKICNCLKKENCPMRGACLNENILYYARISCDDETYKRKLYKGICETTFKKRYANHKKSFVEKNKNDTKLSTKYWKLANKKLHLRISWSIKGNYKSYNPNLKRCSLCLHQELEILNDSNEMLLNKRSEVISQCRHRNKCKLKAGVSNKKNLLKSTLLQVYRKYMLWRFSEFLGLVRGGVYP